MKRDKRRRARGVDGKAGTRQSQRVRDTTRCDGKRVCSSSVHVHATRLFRCIATGWTCIQGPANPKIDSDVAIHETLPTVACAYIISGKSTVRSFEDDELLRADSSDFSMRHPPRRGFEVELPEEEVSVLGGRRC